MVMANKIVDKEFLANLLEDMDMFDVIEVIKEKYVKEGELKKSCEVHLLKKYLLILQNFFK